MSGPNGKPIDQVVGLQTLTLSGRAIGASVPMLARTPENVFTPDEWVILRSLDSLDLFLRYQNGARFLALLAHPSIGNLTDLDRGRLSSLYRYQMEGIKRLIADRPDPVSQSIIQKIEGEYRG